MTLDEFRATGRNVPDLGAIDHIAASGQSGPGRTYLDDTLFIEQLPRRVCSVGPVRWCLTIGNSQRVASLATLERDLYEFAVSEGYINA